MSDEKVKSALNVYGIDPKNMSTGWGIAVDMVYDKLTENLINIIQMLQRCLEI